MSKALLLLSFLSLMILAVGTALTPHSQLFLLAASGTSYEYIRGALGLILFAQLITHPPRNLAFRILAGAIAATVAGWALYLTYNGVMPFLDTFSLLAAASAIGVTALEVRPAKKNSYSRRSNTNPLIA